MSCFILVLASIYQGERLRFSRHEALPEKAPSSESAAGDEKIHLWMVMVDSWPLRLLGRGHMPFVDSLLDKSVYGSAAACADALSVPCIKAIYTGQDIYSVFFLFRDVMTADQKIGGSILEELGRRGYTIGIAANHSWNQLRHAYDHAVLHDLGNIPPDHVVVDEAVDIFEKHKPDIMMTAIIDLDHAAHKYKPGSKEYYDEALESDRLVKKIHDMLPDGWHLLVFGDHGHDEAGRHVPGLEIPASYVYHGPAFREGVRKDIDVRTHYFILSGLFKVPPHGQPISENLDDLFKPGWIQPDFFPPSAAREAESGFSKTMANLHDSLAYEILFLLLLMAAGVVVFKAALPGVSTARAASLVGAAFVFLYVQGLAYVWLRETLYQQWWGWDYVLVAVEFLACVALGRLLRKDSPQAALAAASVLFYLLTLFLHLGTIYNFGATRYLMHGLVIATAVMIVVHLRTRPAPAEPVTGSMLLLLLAAVLAVLNIDMLVVNFKFRYLYWSHALFGAVPPAVVYGLASGLLCAVLFNRRRDGVAAYVILSGIVMAAPLVPPLGFAVLLGLALLLQLKDAAAPAALPWIRYEWKIVLALVYLFYFLEFSFERMTEMVVVILAGTAAIRAMGALHAQRRLPASFRDLLPLLGALVVVTLGLYTFWISFSMRIGGIQLVPILKWLPMDKMTSSWPFIMFVMIYVFVTPMMILLAVFRRAFVNDRLLGNRVWFFVGLGKILAVSVFLRALVLNEPGQFVLRDSFEELIVWIVIAVTGAFALLPGRDRPAGEQAARSA